MKLTNASNKKKIIFLFGLKKRKKNLLEKHV